jgi:RimJ/RimL family protein N-acetyltransferase
MSDVQLQPWSEEDLPLLEKLLGDPAMMTYLGGPESQEQILRRHQRYIRLPEDGTDHMFKIVWEPDGAGVGNVGYWRKTWRDQAVYETGWLVLRPLQSSSTHGVNPDTHSCMHSLLWRMRLPTRSAVNLALRSWRKARSNIRPDDP